MYVTARTKEGKRYQKPTDRLLGLRGAMCWYTKQTRTEVNIYTEPEFLTSNDVLDEQLKELKLLGVSSPAQHKAAMTTADRKTSNAFHRSEPSCGLDACSPVCNYVPIHYSRVREPGASVETGSHRKTDNRAPAC